MDGAPYINGLVRFVSDNGTLPEDASILCAECQLDHESFYDHFDSLEDLYHHTWLDVLESTLTVLAEDPQYPSFSIREKLLAFYFTQAEFLGQRREFVREMMKKARLKMIPDFLRPFKKRFDQFIIHLIDEGKGSGEVAQRLVPSKYYTYGFWVQQVFILRFWAKDSSAQKEKSDAAIEKAVNLSMDLIGPNAFDSVVDLGKFLIQNRK